MLTSPLRRQTAWSRKTESCITRHGKGELPHLRTQWYIQWCKIVLNCSDRNAMTSAATMPCLSYMFYIIQFHLNVLQRYIFVNKPHVLPWAYGCGYSGCPGGLQDLLFEDEDALPLFWGQHGDLFWGQLQHLHDQGSLENNRQTGEPHCSQIRYWQAVMLKPKYLQKHSIWIQKESQIFQNSLRVLIFPLNNYVM